MKTYSVISTILIFYISGGYHIKIMQPGTKWCGNGNSSNSEEEVGIFFSTDKCCREHDMCPDNIKAHSWKHGLFNNDASTKSHCSCDKIFYNCLKKDYSPVSTETGISYFNIMKPQCFDKTYPIIKCEKKKHGQCVKYLFDTSAKPIYWQWFDNPLYI